MTYEHSPAEESAAKHRSTHDAMSPRKPYPLLKSLAFVPVAWIVLTASTLRADITAEQVRTSIDRATEFLTRQQRTDGSWPEYGSYIGGVTSLCTLALLNAGVDPDDEVIQKALTWLRQLEPRTTYAASLQTMVFCKAQPQRDLLLINRNVKWLESVQITDGLKRGAWSYPRASGDNSNSQFALLALHEAERVGVSVSSRTWRLAKAYWEDCQNVDGSWGYVKGAAGTGSMTCAGIASMMITTGKVLQADARAVGERVQCCGQGPGGENERIERGLAWLGRNFSVTANPGNERLWLLYYLYGVERVGRLSARRFLGGHDWYREGTEYLVRQQDSLSGFFKGVGHAEDDPLIATSLALLFLSKGRRPLLLAKMNTGGDDWNQHRNDVANLTRAVESRWKLDLTWQVVDIRAATVEDLLQTPVLYLCGSEATWAEPPAARQRLARKLRDYLDRGGFLFFEAYCGGVGFDEAVRKLIADIFPEPEYRLHLLDPNHPIWHAEQRIAPDQLRPLWGIEFGCRTSVVYAPLDPPGSPQPSLSCLWELARMGRDQDLAPSVQRQVDAAVGLGVNILAYATNRELRGKEESFRIATETQQEDPFQRGRLSVAQLRHPGGCNAAPRALTNLMETAGQELRLRTGVRDKLLDIADDDLFNHHLVFMHGRNRFRLTDEERAQLKAYLERGGMLMADAICGSPAFRESFRREMEAIFPQKPLEPIPSADPMLTPTYGGFDLSLVTRRDPQQRGGGQLQATLRRVPAELEGIRFGDRWGVIFSPFDISCALEKHDSLECRGYVREDARRIGLNVLLYSLQQ